MEARREEFRKYLEDVGVIAALTKAIIKLYEMKYDRPESALLFLKEQLASDLPTATEHLNLINELNELKAKLAMYENAGEAGMSNQIDNETATNLVISLLGDPDCNSLLKKYLTIEMFDKLKHMKTSFGTRLIDCINSGLQNHKSLVGIYAADAEAYETFGEIFIPIIEEYHKFTSDMTHPEADWGDVSSFENLDPNNEFIVSTRIRCARSVKEFALNPLMKKADYLALMDKMKESLAKLTDDLSGTLLPLDEMDEATKQQMIDDHYLFKEGDKYLEAASATNFWPTGRAIFKNAANTFFVWVNEEDHLRFISMGTGGDIAAIYSRLKNAVTQCSNDLEFSRHPRFGWLTFCPTNLGTTIRASVMIKVPKLAAKENALQELADQSNLQIRGTHGKTYIVRLHDKFKLFFVRTFR